MLPVLDALVAWRESVIPTLACSHALSSHVVTNALPSSRLTARPYGTYAIPVCVPLEVTETITVEASGDEDNPVLTATLALLRAMSGKARVQSRIHSHVLVSETPQTDANMRRQVVLVWRVVASW